MDQSTFSSFSNSDRTEISGTHLNSSDPGQDSTKRRSSSRSIKRRRFDDELVEYSLGLPGASNIKSSRTRTHSVNSTQVESPLAAGGSSTSGVTGAGASPSVGATASVDNKRRQSGKGVGQSSSRRSKKGRQHSHIATKDLGRWKPTDDLALIIGVQQTNDLRTVHLGTKFSCRFTVQELQQRWYALLYDQAVSRVAVAAMRNLHPEMIAAVQDKALWSTQEEQLLATIKSNSQPGLEQFEELLSKNSEVFYPSRTAKSLQRHWATLRMYHLLPDQSVAPLPNTDHPAVLTFTDAEEAIQDSELNEPVDEALDREIRLAQRKNAHEIRHLENELSRWSVLVDSVTSPSPAPVPGDLDNQTLAVLRGRLVRYLMRSREITIGRCTKANIVDIDLALEGPAHKISRRQGTLRLRNTGEFYLSSEGKRPIFVDGRPILAGNKVRLYNNSVVEIASLRFIFSVNQEIIRAIHNEAVKMNLPP